MLNKLFWIGLNTHDNRYYIHCSKRPIQNCVKDSTIKYRATTARSAVKQYIECSLPIILSRMYSGRPDKSFKYDHLVIIESGNIKVVYT